MTISWKTRYWRVNYTFPSKEHTHLVVDEDTTDYFVYPHYGVYCVGAILGNAVVPLSSTSCSPQKTKPRQHSSPCIVWGEFHDNLLAE